MATIYIIDDEDTIQFLYKEGLSLAGHTILGSAKSGEQAISEFDHMKNYPDIIIMDHRMPNKNGLETLREMSSSKILNKSKVLFITADPTVREEAGKLGITLFLQKPFSIIKLAQIISNLTN